MKEIAMNDRRDRVIKLLKREIFRFDTWSGYYHSKLYKQDIEDILSVLRDKSRYGE